MVFRFVWRSSPAHRPGRGQRALGPATRLCAVPRSGAVTHWPGPAARGHAERRRLLLGRPLRHGHPRPRRPDSRRPERIRARRRGTSGSDVRGGSRTRTPGLARSRGWGADPRTDALATHHRSHFWVGHHRRTGGNVRRVPGLDPLALRRPDAHHKNAPAHVERTRAPRTPVPRLPAAGSRPAPISAFTGPRRTDGPASPQRTRPSDREPETGLALAKICLSR